MYNVSVLNVLPTLAPSYTWPRSQSGGGTQ